MEQNIYDYIKKEEAGYEKPIELEDGWSWGMKEHLRRSFLYLNSQFTDDNEDRELRPNKNIILAIINVQLRTLDIDVKDIELFVDNKDEYYKSHLCRKFHEKWALDNQIDTFIDELISSYDIYGGTLVKNVGKKKPVVVNLRDLAFASQRDIINYPFCIKHTMSISEIRDMDKWGDDSNGATIDKETFISLVQKEEKDEAEIYEVVGVLPADWLNDNDEESDKKDELQTQIVAYYKAEGAGDEKGVTLYKKRLPKLNFKFLRRDKIEGRALGRGGVEELFEPQIWTNWNEIKITEMLESASKTIMLSDDPQISAKHPKGLKGMDNLSIVETNTAAKGLWQADTFPRNLEKFNNDVNSWQQHAQMMGGANESLLGEEPNAGTPFKLYEAQQVEGKSLHKWRQGQIAAFLDEVYRDWVIKYIQSEITNDISFLAELSADEMMEVSEQLSENQSNNYVNEKVLNGEVLLPGDKEEHKLKLAESFLSGGSRKFVDILKDDFKSGHLAVRTNIKGKQKNMALITDKMVSFVRQVLNTPQIRQDPEMIKWTNSILESSGLSPMMFSAPPQAAQPQGGGGTEPLKNLSQANEGSI